MRTIAVIPARYAATRFPAKLMQVLGNKTVIRHTYENAVATGLFDEVMVATDSELIFHEIESNGGNARMSLRPHESGSDRIAEAVADLDVDVIVNVQGDEPFIQHKPLADLLASFRDPETMVASLMQKLESREDIHNPNIVKVVTDLKGFALYFSRAVIPYPREEASGLSYFRHIGVYGFRKHALMDFTRWPSSMLEKTEKLEQLRYLENGIRIRMIETNFTGIGIDTPEDLERARKLI
ncbi:MAG: 3-deoxy-manno-octulosonate cytidylyltransferase [Chitinophagaceae bacterium]|jgi:3-deoxy-manno-octulosonate cytidylyltransferase (CMP-KDO synthetase)|nr:3-deoxy-manno-octulosonate cytidylyltransferase [Chitinophagaceae bacterium]